MKNMIKELEIENFKSIKYAKLDCKRINVFIGEPNVGKSNLLEAISTFSAHYSENRSKILSELIRYERFSDLFYDHNLNNQVNVRSNLGFVNIKYRFNVDFFEFILSSEQKVLDALKSEHSIAQSLNNFDNFINSATYLTKNPLLKPIYLAVNNDGYLAESRKSNTEANRIRKYIFNENIKIDSRFNLYLKPPYGNNLMTILQTNSKFADEVAGFFEKFGFDFVLNFDDQKLLLQKRTSKIVNQFSYYLIADTLKRIIFHLAAIESNKNSVLLFEEPESHLYPPYIAMLAERIVNDENNQYFLTTHNPYMFNTLLEDSKEDIAVFYTYFENYQTKIKALTDNDLDELLNHGTDIFFNFN